MYQASCLFHPLELLQRFPRTVSSCDRHGSFVELSGRARHPSIVGATPAPPVTETVRIKGIPATTESYTFHV